MHKLQNWHQSTFSPPAAASKHFSSHFWRVTFVGATVMSPPVKLGKWKHKNKMFYLHQPFSGLENVDGNGGAALFLAKYVTRNWAHCRLDTTIMSDYRKDMGREVPEGTFQKIKWVVIFACLTIEIFGEKPWISKIFFFFFCVVFSSFFETYYFWLGGNVWNHICLNWRKKFIFWCLTGW